MEPFPNPDVKYRSKEPKLHSFNNYFLKGYRVLVTKLDGKRHQDWVGKSPWPYKVHHPKNVSSARHGSYEPISLEKTYQFIFQLLATA